MIDASKRLRPVRAATAVRWLCLIVLPLLLVCIACLGCGARMHQVGGVVQYEDGKPATDLAGGSVELESVELKVSARGGIDKDGRFVLGTEKTAGGMPVGTFKVRVTAPPPINPDAAPPPGGYNLEVVSPAEVTVEGANTDLVIKVKRRKK